MKTSSTEAQANLKIILKQVRILYKGVMFSKRDQGKVDHNQEAIDTVEMPNNKIAIGKLR